MTAVEDTLKFAELPPGTTVMLGGTVALAELLDSATTNPAGGAALESVTVPVEGVPPTTVVGETDSELTDWANPVQHIAAEIKTNNDLRNLGWAISSSILSSKQGGILPSSSYRVYLAPNYKADAWARLRNKRQILNMNLLARANQGFQLGQGRRCLILSLEQNIKFGLNSHFIQQFETANVGRIQGTRYQAQCQTLFRALRRDTFRQILDRV